MAVSTQADAAPDHALTRLLRLGRPAIMGILNVTPDSFSDGGRFVDTAVAAAHAERMVREGADVLDIGGESTRPYGSVPVTAAEEWARVAPVLAQAVRLGVPVSIDTMKAEVAARALDAGAVIVNDVWGLQRDDAMARVAKEHDAGLIVMHNRETADPAIDILAEVETFLARSVALAEQAGVARARIVVDPGIGFGKTPEQSLRLIARLERLRVFGLPILMGLSRKRFIASVSPSQPNERLGGSIAGNIAAARRGAAILRVHDVAETVQALLIHDAIERAR